MGVGQGTVGVMTGGVSSVSIGCEKDVTIETGQSAVVKREGSRGVGGDRRRTRRLIGPLYTHVP